MLRQARHFSDPSRQCCVVELIEHSAEPLFTGHLRLRRTDQKARCRRPDITRALKGEISRFVQMSAGDEGNPVPPDQRQKRPARLWFDRPITGIAFARILKKQRPVQEPGNPPLSRFGHHLFEPQRLLVLLRLAAARQHHVKSDKTPVLRTFCDIFDPAIRAEMSLPRAEPLGIDRLVGMLRVADIMVAGDRPPAGSEFVHQLGGEAEVSFDPGAISGHIAGMDHEIGMLVGIHAASGPQLRTKCGLAGLRCVSEI